MTEIGWITKRVESEGSTLTIIYKGEAYFLANGLICFPLKVHYGFTDVLTFLPKWSPRIVQLIF